MSQTNRHQTPKTGRKPLLFDICSAMKNAGRRNVDAFTPALNIISRMETDQCL